MPISKIFLPDVNVWLALVSGRHLHAQICGAWLNALQPGSVALCRVSQMGLLRLLTSESVMGKDVLLSRNAWRAYRAILADERVSLVPEPFSLEEDWAKLTIQDMPTPKVWTDSYLSAFAHRAGMRLVTLDPAVLTIVRIPRHVDGGFRQNVNKDSEHVNSGFREKVNGKSEPDRKHYSHVGMIF
jgi:toxin-antitoxin system PIN domain toxin